MQAIQHYGIVISWFQDKQLGVVRDKDDTGSRLLLLAADLPAGYREPKVGDEITYIAGTDNKNRPCALSPHLVGNGAQQMSAAGAVVREGDLVRIKVDAWDIKKNGGFGMLASEPEIPVFALGQYLNQFNVPQVGDILTGRLKRHANGQWLLTGIDIVYPEAQDALEEPVAEQ
ncbi:hypothetical protein HMPREF9123_0204 [Neisseria bacilliformis ATCC BAA-1200]|jgi:hypothetical protein|uniref:Uncharacterized protein n=1 Tax=Neisseria bacilliformis ATCC BAA-1200 TaxID=888742 RepID=F2B961_9NEIS|nr:hypothetical protein [Neisseria bacilliformis]EGF11998.1 hypothetical protein HMPREF9123_0204 [Neisseria bacilliformis ATCC BAA-1200]QMT47538.1 hypothetical protein H3L91_11830 [Neisseria bacilliformis]